MFYFGTLIDIPPTEETSEGPWESGTGDRVPDVDANGNPVALPPAMLVVDGAIPVAPPYYRRKTTKRTCRWVESRFNELLETDGDCVTVLAMWECVTVTRIHVAWNPDSEPKSLPPTAESQQTLRLVTICGGTITKEIDVPDDWRPTKEALAPEKAAAEEKALAEANANATLEAPSTPVDPSTPSPDPATPTGTPPAPDETPEQREQRLRDHVARRAVDRDAVDPDRPPAGIGDVPPPPTKDADGRDLWKYDAIIADVVHGFSQRRDEGDFIIVTWAVWIALDVRRAGCVWTAIYEAYTITFRISRSSGLVVSKSASRDFARPPTTRTQVIPGCTQTGAMLYGDAFWRPTGAAIAIAGRFPTLPADQPMVLVVTSHGVELAREKLALRKAGLFGIALDVRASVGPEGDVLDIVALAKQGALSVEARVRLPTTNKLGLHEPLGSPIEVMPDTATLPVAIHPSVHLPHMVTSPNEVTPAEIVVSMLPPI